MAWPCRKRTSRNAPWIGAERLQRCDLDGLNLAAADRRECAQYWLFARTLVHPNTCRPEPQSLRCEKRRGGDPHSTGVSRLLERLSA